jgi:hypothetical protein
MGLIPKLFADFNNADAQGRVRLTTQGSLADISDNNIKMEEGIELQLDDNEGLSTIGTAHFSNEEKIWVAVIDWNCFKP